MDWIARLTSAMTYIEENLCGEIDWAEAGRRAMCSSHQFARTFVLMTDVPLSEYVRRRRLTLAAQDLQQRGDKVLDVALRYGYASPTAFQRAFVLMHGITPSQARKPGALLKAYPPMSFHITIQGGIALQYRLEEKPAFRVVGYAEEISMINGENFVRIPKMWDEFSQEKWGALEAASDGKYPGCFGLIDVCPKNTEKMLYAICVSSQQEALPSWARAFDIPAANYAVFETSMADIQTTTKRVYGEWLPNSGYEHAEMPEFEYYPAGDMSDPAKYICEIWVPVTKRA